MTWFDEMEALSRSVDRLLARRGLDGTHGLLRTWAQANDGEIVEQEDAWLLSFDLPGFSRSEVHVTVKDDTVTLEAHRDPVVPEGARAVHRERRAMELQRSWRLPQRADAAGIRAELVDGVLTVAIPKRAEVRPRPIQIHTV